VFLDDFDFDLPKSAIALRPASPRDSARLLVVKPGGSQPLVQETVRALPELLLPGDVLVLNNTKVLPAELKGIRRRREADAPSVAISLTLFERLPNEDWKAFALPGRRLRAGDVLIFGECAAQMTLQVRAKEEGGAVIIGPHDGCSVEAVMMAHGRMPLPPYIGGARPSDRQDRDDYQTVYAEREGAVAAPTAGLHFTAELLQRLASRDIDAVHCTLHVGPGTFLPVKHDIADCHELHSEWCEITQEAADTINKARAGGGRVVAVGTTSIRVLETAAKRDGTVGAFAGHTRLFIKPGYRFRSADLLLTNFHLPKSTLFMLVCAFSGTSLMKSAYAHALVSGYRFYSYGDACLLYPSEVSTR